MLLPFVRDIFAEVEQLPAFRRATSHLRESTERISVSGLSPAAKALIVVLLQRRLERPIILVTADNRAAEDLLPILGAFAELTGSADPDSIVTLPARDVLPFQNLSPIPRFRKSAPLPSGELPPAALPSSFRRSQPPPSFSVRPNTTPTSLASFAVAKLSISKSSFST